MKVAGTPRETMTGYYAWHSRIYDATRWAFLFDRSAIVDDLQLEPNETVIEVGAGTGANIEKVVNKVGSGGRVIAVDCSGPMLERCGKRIVENGWRNVELVDSEYGQKPVAPGQADAVLMSYSLSMIPDWEQAVKSAFMELKAGGRIGVVDFCLQRRSAPALAFSSWMKRNHVILDRPYQEYLQSVFRPVQCATRDTLGGLWTLYRFVGQRA